MSDFDVRFSNIFGGKSGFTCRMLAESAPGGDYSRAAPKCGAYMVQRRSRRGYVLGLLVVPKVQRRKPRFLNLRHVQRRI